MDIFTAIAEPTRREILVLLANNGQLSASEIYLKFTSTPPAISQHLKVLRDAKLVIVEKKAQQRFYQINTSKLSELDAWIKTVTKEWEGRFDRIEKILEREKKKLNRK